MYRVNIFIRFLILILLYVIIIFTYNPIINWLLFITIVFLHFLYKKYYFLFIDLIISLILFLSNYYVELFLPFKLFMIVLFTIEFITTMNLNEKLLLNLIFNKKKNKILRSSFYDNNIKKVNNYNKSMVMKVYENEDINIDGKNIRDLDRLYLQSRIRFNGIKRNGDKDLYIKINKIDIMILLLAIILFVILFIFR